MEARAPMMVKLDDIMPDPPPSDKITIVGVGQVGMACAFALSTLNVTNEIALFDIDVNKLKGETLDLQYGSAFIPSVKIYGDTDYSVTKDSKICIITAGARQKEGQTRTELLNQNIKILEVVVTNLLKYSPHAILLIVANPVDILTYATWKISGRPLSTIIGTGTSLDTARFKYLISQKIGLSIESVHGWIIGEHGDASVPVWSSLQVGGVNLKDLNHPSGLGDPEQLNKLHDTVINSAYEIIRLKGYTSWAIGLNVADICKSIIHDTKNVHAVSTLIKGFHGVENDVFLSLPCVLGRSGISYVIPLTLSAEEKEAFLQASSKIYGVQQELDM